MKRLLVAALCLGGCAAPLTEAQTPAPATPTSSSCTELGALVDLEREMTTPSIPSTAPLAGLVDAEEELAYARAARAHATDEGTRASLERLVALLDARVTALDAVTKRANESHAVASAVLREASTCRGLDLRELAKQNDKSKSEDVALARSKACDAPLRLWAATKNVDLTSELSTARTASALADVRVDKEHAAVRTHLAEVLTAHAARLRALTALTADDASSPALRELALARSELSERIRATYHACLAPTPVRATAKGPAADPRSATVMVRPTWSGALSRLPSAQDLRFGSGFVLRWNAQAFVLTNRHVMDGAIEAEVVFASETRREKRIAKLVSADRDDDIAVLRIDGDAPAALALRLDPPREQEVVIAAGFPGIGATPSYQVTRGVVSNAHFGAEKEDAGIAYLQHTAAIDPGNSGGPLLDDGGRLVGMNTAKLRGRDNVSIAIPAARLRFALARTDQPRAFERLHAEASCNAALDALSAEHPSMDSIRRFGWRLIEQARPVTTRVVVTEIESPIDEARVRGFESARELVQADGGIAAFQTCSDVGGSAPAFSARMRTRSGVAYRVALAVEGDDVRVTSITREQ